MLLGTIAVIAAGIGAALLIYSVVARRDLQLLKRAGHVSSPREGQRIAVCGKLEIVGEPLLSPIRQRESAFYYWNAYHLEPSVTSDSPDPKVDYAGYGAVPAAIRGPNFTAPLGVFPHVENVPERDIDTPLALANAREFVRFATFSALPQGEMIEYVPIIERMWDGKAPATRNFRRGAGHDLKSCKFSELSVAPGAEVCAVGIWSGGVLIGTPRRGLMLHEGSPETVRERFSSGAGCAMFFGIVLLAVSLASSVFLAMN